MSRAKVPLALNLLLAHSLEGRILVLLSYPESITNTVNQLVLNPIWGPHFAGKYRSGDVSDRADVPCLSFPTGFFHIFACFADGHLWSGLCTAPGTSHILLCDRASWQSTM